MTIPAANFVTSDTKTGIPFHARGPTRILVYGMQRQIYSTHGLLAFQNNERSAQMFAVCILFHFSHLPLAKLRNDKVMNDMGKSFSRLRLDPR